MIIEILQHLQTTYGLLTANDLETNCNKLMALWNPDEPLTNIWKHIKIIRTVAITGNEARWIMLPPNLRSWHSKRLEYMTMPSQFGMTSQTLSKLGIFSLPILTNKKNSISKSLPQKPLGVMAPTKPL
jgi:hypothetical protein